MPKQSSQRGHHNGHRRLETPTESNIDAWLENPDHKPTTGSPMLDGLLKKHGIFDYLRTTVRAEDANVKPLTPPEGLFKRILVWILTVAGVKAAPHVNVVYRANNYNRNWKIYLIIGWSLVTFLTLPVTKVRNAVGTHGWGEFDINTMCPPPSKELALEIKTRVEKAAHLEEAKEQAKLAAGSKIWADTITTKGKTAKGDILYPKWPTGCDRNAQEQERNAALSQRCTEEICASLIIDLKCTTVDIPCPKSTTSMDALMRNYEDYQRLKTQDRKPQDSTKRGSSDLLDDEATSEMNRQADIFTQQIRVGSFLFNCFTLIMLLLAPPAPYSTTSSAIKIKRGISGISKITFILGTVLILQAYAFLKATSFEPILRYVGTPCQFSKEISKIRSNAITDTCKAVIELGQQRVANTYQFEDFQAAVKPYGICDDLSEKWISWGINDGYPFATTAKGLVIPQNESYNTNWTFESLKVQLGQEYKGQCNLTTMAKALLEDYPVDLAVEMQLEVGPKLMSLIFQNILPSIFFSWLVVLVYVIHPQTSYSGKFEAPPHVFDRSPWLKDAAARDIKNHARLSNIFYLILWSALMIVAAYYIITAPKIKGSEQGMPSLDDFNNTFGSGSGSGSMWDGSM